MSSLFSIKAPLVMGRGRRRVLLVSYLFPPMGGISVQRALSLARYLPLEGFDVHVLTALNAASPVRDPELLKYVPADVHIHKAFTPEPPFRFRHFVWGLITLGRRESKIDPSSQESSPDARGHGWMVQLVRRIFCPEPEIVWIPFALRKARQIVRRCHIDVVMVTAPPFSAFLVGNALKREFPSLTYISDFRDEWLTFYLKQSDYQSGEYTRRRAEQIERETVELSDRIVAVTHPSLKEIRSRYPDQPENKFICLSNGYDPSTFQGFLSRPHSGSQVIITHLGTVYRTASARHYLNALDGLSEGAREKIETRYIGRIADTERGAFENRKTTIKLLGFLPQGEALKLVEETDYLLLTLTDDISLPGKLFEYMVTGKPILAISPLGGEVDRMFQETRVGWCVDPGDAEALKALLQSIAEGTLTPPDPDWDAIRRYERPRLVAEYGRVIREAMGVLPEPSPPENRQRVSRP